MSTTNSEALARLVALTGEGYPFANLQKRASDRRVDVVAPTGSHPSILTILSQYRRDRRLTPVQLIIVATGREAEETASALRILDPGCEVLEFQSWETLPHERLSPSAETVGKRLQVLHRMRELTESLGADGTGH